MTAGRAWWMAGPSLAMAIAVLPPLATSSPGAPALAASPAATPPTRAGLHAPPGAVTLRAQPGTALDAEARRLVAEDLRSAGDDALVLIGTARLGRPAHGGVSGGDALLVQVQSPLACGSGGCSTAVFLRGAAGWRRVLDDVSGSIAVSPARHGGMQDLLVDGTDRWVWNGTRYVDTVPAPPVDLHHARPGRRAP